MHEVFQVAEWLWALSCDYKTIRANMYDAMFLYHASGSWAPTDRTISLMSFNLYIHVTVLSIFTNFNRIIDPKILPRAQTLQP